MPGPSGPGIVYGMERDMKPVIAIPRLGPGLTRLYFRHLFVTALTEAGAEVRWIGPENIGAVTACDGLLLPGGDDVNPAFYGQEKSRKILCGISWTLLF